MQKEGSEIIFSASDLANFLDCEHLTALDLKNFDMPMEKAADDENALLIQKHGYAHEQAFAARLKSKHKTFVDISQVGKDKKKQLDATIQAMKDGIEVIYQAALRYGNVAGYSDFLRRVEYPSQLGSYSYEVLDTKLARSPRAKFLIQLAFYSELVSTIQKTPPKMMYVVLGSGKEIGYRLADYTHYYSRLKTKFMAKVGTPMSGTYPNPCDRCSLCHWRENCEKHRIADDHLSQVASISRIQIKKLNAAGIPHLRV